MRRVDPFTRELILAGTAGLIFMTLLWLLFRHLGWD